MTCPARSTRRPLPVPHPLLEGAGHLQAGRAAAACEIHARPPGGLSLPRGARARLTDRLTLDWSADRYTRLVTSCRCSACEHRLIVLVLLHKGKGGGLSNLFGGGVSSSLGGSAVVEKNLDRLTIVCGAVWSTCIIALGLLLKQTSLRRPRA